MKKEFTKEVQLIPVIKIDKFPSNMTMPDGSAKENPYGWARYDAEGLLQAGFEYTKPYLLATRLYELKNITEANLKQLIFEEIEDYNEENGIASLPGGYILNMDGRDLLYPQCCGSLEDIDSWKILLEENGKESSFWIGHPSPSIIDDGDFLIFDLEHSNVQENYFPDADIHLFSVPKEKLKKAIDEVDKELEILIERINKINEQLPSLVPNLGERMVIGSL